MKITITIIYDNNAEPGLKADWGFSKFEALKDMEHIGACHCTQHKKELQEKFPESFRENKAGTVINV